MFLKFLLTFAPIMKEKILKRAIELFLELGFKSVTMDDIAESLGISKKTIYSHYSTKGKLVEDCAANLFCTITEGIDEIIAEKHNPIDESFNIHRFILSRLKKEKASPQYQLQKYYPKIERKLRQQKIERMQECVVNNLKRGVKEGYYRPEIEIDLVFRFYFMTLEGIRSSDMFSVAEYSIPFLVKNFSDYHLRGIVSEKGLTYINNLAKKCNS